MVDGEIQNYQGLSSDIQVVVVKPTTPSGYCFIVEHSLTEVTCPTVSTNVITKRERTMGGGVTQNFQGFPSNMPVIIVKHFAPYGYCLSVEHLLTKVTWPAVSTDTSANEILAYHG